MKEPYIYKIIDLKKGNVCYVGKHNGTLKNYITSSKKLLRYISIWGLSNFTLRFKREIVEYCSLEELNEKEEYYVAFYGTFIDGLNMTKGGDWDWRYKVPIRKAVTQYSKEGVKIANYESAAEASRQTGVNASDIGATCLGKQKSSGGFIWRFQEEKEPSYINVPSRKLIVNRKVGRSVLVSIEGILYKSIQEASYLTKIRESLIRKRIKESIYQAYTRVLLDESTNRKFKTLEEASTYYKIHKSTLLQWVNSKKNNILKLKWTYEKKN